VKRAICGILSTLILACAGVATAQEGSHLMRWADIHGTEIVFTYEGDLWLVTAPGGIARRITRDAGIERYAKFSPDGSQLAFTAQYDGGTDVYVMPATGGEPQRLTYHPSSDRVLGWTADGTSVLFRSRREYPGRAEQVYAVSPQGGMPVQLPVDRAGLASLSPDGASIAYNRGNREDRTWKRHQGGTAQDIWVGSFAAADFRRVTDWVGTDNYPMWQGGKIYFASDRNHGTLNLFEMDPNGANVRPLTDYSDYDVKYPSQGPGQIVFQYAESLYVLVLATGQVLNVPVTIPTDAVSMRPKYVKVDGHIGSYRLSPSGARLLLESRGEILSIPTGDEGQPINLTGHSGSREKGAVWSPDGRFVAFFSDLTGEEEVYVVASDGSGPWRPVTSGGLGYRMGLEWSPDGRYLLFADKFMRLNLVEVASGKITVIDQSAYDDAWERWGIQEYSWSPCSHWVAYAKMETNMNESVYLYSLDTGKTTRVTGPMTADWSPTFDAEGRYLYFLSNRTYQPIMGHVDQNHIFLDLTRPYMVLLRHGEPSPFLPEDPVEPAVEEDDEDDGKAKRDKKGATIIDLDGLEHRTLALDGVSAGTYFRLDATEDGVQFLRRDEPVFLKYDIVVDDTDGGYSLVSYNLADKEADTLIGGIGNTHLSGDGAKLLYRAGKKLCVVDAGASADQGDGKVDLGQVRILVDRRQEFLQIFNEAWRVQRDWYYDAGMHQVDWAAEGEKYRRFVPNCGNRDDLNYLIGELIGELNTGHTYVWGGDKGKGAARVSTGMLGAEFDTPAGAAFHRISHIVPGTSWDPSERSPLDAPGCPIQVGHYLIAIDGQPVPFTDNIWRLLQDKAGKLVTLTYNSQPSAEGALTVQVEALGSESAIRYREWVNSRLAYVHQASDGKVGYVHIPNMGEAGLIEFAKSFYAQVNKQAMVIDVRYNGGGFTGDMIIDRLERQLWAMTQPREGLPCRDPERAFHGPLAVVINMDSGSNAEFFSEAIKRKGLAKVVGKRTWGGSIGIEPHQDLVDGGMTTPPQFGLYGMDRTWLIEGHGVDPHVEVANTPADMLAGRDPQLQTAIDLLLTQLSANPPTIPPAPVYPDKSKPQ